MFRLILFSALVLAPPNGRAILERMHARYAGQWFSNLTFEQATTVQAPDGKQTVTTWYEAVQAPGRLRIDIADPSSGNGMLYTGDSTYVVRKGAITRAEAEGNPFLPFVVGVYTQPVERTLKELAPLKFDLSRVRLDRFDNRPVYVVGAKSPTDLSSPQFWVDTARLVVVRMIVRLGPEANAKAYDIRLEKYVPVGKSWLATHIVMQSDGVVRQTEDYSNWQVDRPLSQDLFDATRWTTAPHWRASAVNRGAVSAEAEIRARLDSTALGWNRADLSQYMSMYTSDASQMGRDSVEHGRDLIERGMRAGFWRTGRPLQTLHYESVEVRMLGSDNALVTGKFVLTGGGRPERTGMFTTIWARTGSGWRLIHDHSS
jgi:uncharacterized protein (TIGR02246 family)